MIKVYRIGILMCLYILNTHFTQAQISQGGEPMSFSPYFQQIIAPDHPLETTVLPAQDPAIIEQKRSRNNGRVQFSTSIPVNFNLNNSGQWIELENGDRLWRLKVRSKRARSIHAYYDEFQIPEGGNFFIYNEDGSNVLGAFTSNNNKDLGAFATSPIYSDGVTFEYFEPASVRGQGKIQFASIEHGILGIAGVNSELKGFGDADPCTININCPEGDDWQTEKQSVATMLMRFDGTGGAFICTGYLINNTNNDARPLFMSAFHCQDNGTPLYDTWTFTFNFEGPACENPSGSPSTSQTIVGCTELSKASRSDYVLLELSESVPADFDPYFVGWDRTGIAPSVVTGIHHPAGDIKKISQATGEVVANADFVNVTGISIFSPLTQWVLTWDSGDTEGGSSGSPLFNQDKYAIGQLTGGNTRPPCAFDNVSFYGRLSENFKEVQLLSALDPAGTGQTLLNGYDPAQEFNNLVMIGANTTATECDFTASTPVDIEVRNAGDDAQINFQVAYNISSQGNIVASDTITVSDSLAARSTLTIPLTIDLSATGTYDISTFLVSNADGHQPDDSTGITVTNTNTTAGAQDLAFTRNDGTQLEVKWTPGNGSESIVLMKQGSDFTDQDLPVDGATYEGSGIFTFGDQIGDAYVMYVGDDDSTFISGLETGAQYYVGIISFSCTPPIYFTEGLSGAVSNLVTDLETIQLDNSVNVFPNPAQSELFIQIEGRNYNTVNAEVYNALGEKITETSIGGVSERAITNIDLPDLPSGIYFIKINTEKASITRKIVID